MNAPRWEVVKAELGELLDLPEERRAERLARLGAGDPELAREVESLLAQVSGDASFLERPAAERLGAGEALFGAEGPLPAAPERIGPWRIEAEIGRGGMGSVYRGRRDDGAFDQVVAIKVVRRELASDLLRRRFLAERRILAGLEHPNIARLIDGGATEDGTPYLVLEHVDGEPIDRWADARALGVRARLQLAREVVEAIHFAHQKLVLHRDIKTANVLVDGRGTPKLLDFGIAKLLAPDPADGTGGALADEGGALTELGLARPLTPEWASPEQLRGEPLTTASDVYSLGVLLYVLLTGSRPHGWTRGSRESMEAFAGRIEAARAVNFAASAAPALPSGVARRELTSDLERVVAKALSPEPSGRYATAAALLRDLDRYLAGDPVEAHPPSWRYRLGKLARRHRAAVAAAAVVAVALVAATAVSLRQAALADRERARAEKRFGDVRRLAHVVLFDLSEALENVSGALTARRLLVDNAVRYLDDLAGEAGDEPELLAELATAYDRVSELQGTPNWPGEGRSADALASLERALALRTRLANREGAGAEAKLAEARSLMKLGDILAGRGETRAAEARHREAGEKLAALLAAGAGGASKAELERRLSEIEVALGDDTWELGDVPGAARHYAAAAGRSAAFRAAEPGSDLGLRQSGVIAQRRGDAAAELDDWPAALAHYRASLEVDRELARRAPENAEAQRDLGTDLARLGAAAMEAKRYGDALDSYVEAHELRERLLAAEPGDARAIADAAEGAFSHAQALVALDRLGEARPLVDTALGRWRSLVARDADNARWQDALAQGLTDSAVWEHAAGAHGTAEARLAEAVAMREAVAKAHPDLAANREKLAAAAAILTALRAGQPLPEAGSTLVPWR